MHVQWNQIAVEIKTEKYWIFFARHFPHSFHSQLLCSPVRVCVCVCVLYRKKNNKSWNTACADTEKKRRKKKKKHFLLLFHRLSIPSVRCAFKAVVILMFQNCFLLLNKRGPEQERPYRCPLRLFNSFRQLHVRMSVQASQLWILIDALCKPHFSSFCQQNTATLFEHTKKNWMKHHSHSLFECQCWWSQSMRQHSVSRWQHCIWVVFVFASLARDLIHTSGQTWTVEWGYKHSFTATFAQIDRFHANCWIVHVSIAVKPPHWKAPPLQFEWSRHTCIARNGFIEKRQKNLTSVCVEL